MTDPAAAIESNAGVYTYHCLCNTLLFSTRYEIESLPTRAEPALDNAIILPIRNNKTSGSDLDVEDADDSRLSTVTFLHNMTASQKPMVVRREDGFERRTPVRCHRCQLTIGYWLDDTTQDIFYSLPGALMKTRDMEAGRLPPKPAWAAVES